MHRLPEIKAEGLAAIKESSDPSQLEQIRVEKVLVGFPCLWTVTREMGKFLDGDLVGHLE